MDWNFTFQLSNGDDGSGMFVTQDTPSGGPYLITSIVGGTIAGNPMTLLAPNGLFNDNLLYTTQPLLDSIGLGFVADGAQWAIWSSNGTTVSMWCNNSSLHQDHVCSFPPDPAGSVLSFNVSPASSVPEPAALALLAVGFAGLAVARRQIRVGGRRARV